MAQVQHAAQLWQHIAAHPIFAVLAGFTTGSAFYGALVHPTSPVNIGRRLTAAEAHAPPPVEVDPLPLPPAEPEIPPFSKVDMAYATAYCAPEPVVPNLALGPGYPLAPTTHDSGHQICMLSGVLVAIVGVSVAFKSFQYLRRQDTSKALSDAETIAWLQSEINKAKAEIQSLNIQLRDAQANEQAAKIAKQTTESALQGVQDNLQRSEAQKLSCQMSSRDLRTELDQVKASTRDTENKLLEVDKQLKIKENACLQLARQAESSQHALWDLKASSKVDQDAHIAALAELKAEASDANDRRASQHATEKAALERERDDYITALTTSRAEVSEANALRISQEQEAAAEKAALEHERDNNIAALTASKAEVSEVNALRISQGQEAAAEKAALEHERDNNATLTASNDAALKASQRRVTDLTAEKATLEQQKLAFIQKEQSLVAHKIELEAKVDSWEARCSAYEKHLKEHQEKESAYRKESSSIRAALEGMLEKDDATISSLEQEIADKDAVVASLKTQLRDSKTALGSAGGGHDSERSRLQTKVSSLEEEQNDLTERLKSLQGEKDQLITDLASARQACTQQSGDISGLQSENERLSSELESLNQEKAQLMTGLASAQQACAQKDGDISSLQSKNGQLSLDLYRSQRECIGQGKTLDSLRESEKKKHDQLGETQHYVSLLEPEIQGMRARENELEVELQDLRLEHAAQLEKLRGEHDIAIDAAVQAATHATVLHEQGQTGSAHDKHAAEVKALKSEHDIAIDAIKQKANLQVKELVRIHELAIKQAVGQLTAEKTDAANEAQVTITSLEIKLEETRGTVSSLENKLEEEISHAMSLKQAHDDLKANLDTLNSQKITAEESLKQRNLDVVQTSQQLEQHRVDAKLEIAAKDREIADFTKKFNDLSTEIAGQAQRTQQLKVKLEQKTKELSDHLVSHAADVQCSDEIDEQRRNQIRSLNESAEKDKTQLERLKREKEELQIRANSDAALAQAEVQRLEQTVERADANVHNLKDELDASKKENEQAAKKLEEQRLIDEQKMATNPRSDRVKVPSGLRWSNATIKDDYQDVVRHGILQQGQYRSEGLVSLVLPHADSFYSELPHAIPEPCDVFDGGETHSCGHCNETYGRRDYYNHGRMCEFFFTDYAVFCKHCESLFLSNGAFKKHEEVCGKARKSGIAPEVLAKQPPIDEFDVLEKNATQSNSTSSSFQDVAQKKSAALGSVPGDALVRAVLPFADQDYASCNLSEPVELDAVLPRGFTGDTFNQKFWCDNCKLWYHKSVKSAHLLACNSFFKGRDGHHAHAHCQFCGDIFRDNAGFLKHTELCKMNPSKDLCLFCRELFNVEGNELAKHTPVCYANPNRAHYDFPARRDRREKVTGSQPEATGADANLTMNTSSTTTGPAAKRAALGDALAQLSPQDNEQLGTQAVAPTDEPSNDKSIAVLLAKTDRTSPTSIDTLGDKEQSAAHTATTTMATSTTTPTASQTPSPSAKIIVGSSEFVKVHIGTNRSLQPPVPSTPSPSALSTPGNSSITPDSVLATPFVPKTASLTSNFLGPQGGLGMSRFSPGFVGSHPGPPMNAYNNYSPSPPPSNFQPRGFDSGGLPPPLFNSGAPAYTMNSPFSPHQNNAGFPQGPAVLPQHVQHNTSFQRDIWDPNSFTPLDPNAFGFQSNIPGATGFPPHQPNDSASAPPKFTSRSSRPINTTLGSANTRTYMCRHCGLRLPKAMMLKHNPRCQEWRHGPRNTPPPNSDIAVTLPNTDELTGLLNIDAASKWLNGDVTDPPNSDEPANLPDSTEPVNPPHSDDAIKP